MVERLSFKISTQAVLGGVRGHRLWEKAMGGGVGARLARCKGLTVIVSWEGEV